jgi:uncharacterized protein (TIGR02996 family)
MATRDRLLQAIIASPDDDVPRLVYADFLEETDNEADVARARLIRFQIETARLPFGHPDHSRRYEWAAGMIDKHKAAWFGWVRNDGCRPFPHRGFLDSWFCGSEDGHRADLLDAFAREPITDVTLSFDGSIPPDLGEWPQFARLRRLKLWPGVPPPADVVALLSSPHFSGLRELEYMGNRGTPVSAVELCRLVATRPQFAGLSSLSIISAGVGNGGARALAASDTLSGLRTLALTRCGLEQSGCRALLNSPVLAALTSLDLGGNLRPAAGGEALAAALARSPHLSQLETLVLDDTPVSDRAAGILAGANWPALKRLNLSPQDRIDATVPTDLATMTAVGLRALAGSTWFAGLEDVDLSGHPIGDEGAAILADACLPRLRFLELRMVGLTAAGLHRLVAEYSGQLRRLQVYGNPLGDEGANVLAAAEWPQMAARDSRNQVGLLLGGCEIGNAGAAALLASRTIPESIPELFLGRCPTSSEAVEALATKYPKATIRYGS